MNKLRKGTLKPSMRLRSKMKLSKKLVYIAASFILLAGSIFFVSNFISKDTKAAANVFPLTSGNWNNPLIWSSGAVPTAADNVTIGPLGPSIVITVPANATCSSLAVAASNNSASLIISTGVGLNVVGNASISGGNNAGKIGLVSVQGNGSITIGGNLAISGSGTSVNAVFQLSSTATANLKGSTTLPASPNNYGTISCTSTSTFNFNGVATQTIKLIGKAATDIVYGNILVNNMAGVWPETNITAALVMGNISIQTGYMNTSTFTINLVPSKTFEIQATATLKTNTIGAVSGIPIGVTYILASGSTVEFNGGTQTIPTLVGTDYSNIIVSTAGTKSLAANVAYTGVLTISAGTLDLNGFTLTSKNSAIGAVVRTGGGILSERTNGSSIFAWTVGNITGVHVVPFVSATGGYIPVTYNVTAAGVEPAGIVNFTTYPTAANNTPYPVSPVVVTNVNRIGVDNSANVVDRFWGIATAVYSGVPTATVTLAAQAAEVGALTNLVVQQFNVARNYWDAVVAGQTKTAVSATVAGVNTYGAFTLATNIAPLPIELVSFSAKANNDKVIVDWKSATELNNDYYTLERSADGITYTKINTTKGAGNSSVELKYSVVDDKLPLAINKLYYRLKQTDFDGRFTYSPIVAVKVADFVASFSITSVAPNPFTSNFNLGYVSSTSAPVLLQLYSIDGRLVYQKNLDATVGNNVFSFEESEELKAGLYIVSLRQNDKTITQKIIKS